MWNIWLKELFGLRLSLRQHRISFMSLWSRKSNQEDKLSRHGDNETDQSLGASFIQKSAKQAEKCTTVAFYFQMKVNFHLHYHTMTKYITSKLNLHIMSPLLDYSKYVLSLWNILLTIFSHKNTWKPETFRLLFTYKTAFHILHILII